ncbi:LiaI-LiaF-like domain-containing protein [Gracilibacillus dipsosauri]|uniref:LiaI-LiaF-like transmembrane region domain-containing protein n=1 Tax=Gracilibacillus dipsosauri TaxID=178340 RepID=A0A317L3A1_9BACI|nr:DUF5668 domain-containing protein [Gracilibacillus dipsosauri]PWU68269.1 hypothetical protein DLJ74_07390 [Gracilibacillus dipsosauri]
MKKNGLVAYLFIGIGIFFLLRELKLPILTDFYSWPTLLILLGAAFLIYSFRAKDFSSVVPGVILLGLGIHFHGLNHYPFWIDHWGVYPFIISIAFLIRYFKTKTGLLPGLILLAIAVFAVYVDNKPSWFSWIHEGMVFIERFWPLLLITIGIYMLWRKK